MRKNRNLVSFVCVVRAYTSVYTCACRFLFLCIERARVYTSVYTCA